LIEKNIEIDFPPDLTAFGKADAVQFLLAKL
jgi:hypothetical protein